MDARVGFLEYVVLIALSGSFLLSLAIWARERWYGA
jgi:hypothetical protein